MKLGPGLRKTDTLSHIWKLFQQGCHVPIIYDHSNFDYGGCKLVQLLRMLSDHSGYVCVDHWKVEDEC